LNIKTKTIGISGEIWVEVEVEFKIVTENLAMRSIDIGSERAII
jgi:hypothetical protein